MLEINNYPVTILPISLCKYKLFHFDLINKLPMNCEEWIAAAFSSIRTEDFEQADNLAKEGWRVIASHFILRNTSE